MRRIVWGLIKLSLASLLAGWLLGVFGITQDSILQAASLTRDDISNFLSRATDWTVPRLVLGALVVVPVWLFTYLFLPSGDD